jgi:hypothetical protein
MHFSLVLRVSALFLRHFHGCPLFLFPLTHTLTNGSSHLASCSIAFNAVLFLRVSLVFESRVIQFFLKSLKTFRVDMQWIFYNPTTCTFTCQKAQACFGLYISPSSGSICCCITTLSMCVKLVLSLVVLDYKTCPVSVLHLLQFLPLFCTLTTACNNVVFPHPLLQLNPLYRRLARNPWRCFVITCNMLGSALFCPLYHHFEKLKRTYKTLILLYITTAHGWEVLSLT